MLKGTRGGVLVLAVGMVIAAVTALLVRAALPEIHQLHEDPHVVVAGYAAGLSIIYGVLLAFTVVVVWEQLNKTRRLVEDEANRVADLWRLVGRFEGQVADQLRAALRQYGLTTRAEWEQALNSFWRSLVAVTPRSRGEQIVHGHTLTQFEEFNRVRAERRLSDSERLHPVMWMLLIVGAVATVGSMMFFTLETMLLQALLSAAVGGVLGFILFIIHDLDDPFDGVWSIGPDPIEQAVGIRAAA
jgi:hypothetical protein